VRRARGAWFVLTRRALVAAAVEYKAVAVILKRGEGEKYQLKLREGEDDRWAVAKGDR
jgi:hypothetical protein